MLFCIDFFVFAEELPCPELKNWSGKTCYQGSFIDAFDDENNEQVSSVLDQLSSTYAVELRSRIQSSTLIRLKQYENNFTRLYPDINSFEDDSRFATCKSITRDTLPQQIPDSSNRHIGKLMLVSNQIKGAMLSEVVFRNRKNELDHLNRQHQTSLDQRVAVCVASPLSDYTGCQNLRNDRPSQLIKAENEIRDKYEPILNYLFQQFPMLFDISFIEEDSFSPRVSLNRSDYQKAIMDKFSEVDLSTLTFDINQGPDALHALESGLTSLDMDTSRESYNDKILGLFSRTESAVTSHLSDLKDSAHRLCSDPSRLHHSRAVVLNELQNLRDQNLPIEQFRDQFTEINAGYCRLMRDSPPQSPLFSTANVIGGALVVGGAVAQFLPVAGNLAGAAAIASGSAMVAGTAILGYQTYLALENSVTDEQQYFALTLLGEEDYPRMIEAINGKYINRGLLLSEIGFAAFTPSYIVARGVLQSARNFVGRQGVRVRYNRFVSDNTYSRFGSPNLSDEANLSIYESIEQIRDIEIDPRFFPDPTRGPTSLRDDLDSIRNAINTNVPENMREGFQSALTAMNNQQGQWADYIATLQRETFERMAKSSNNTLRENARRGVLDQEQMVEVLRDRVRANGFEVFEVGDAELPQDFVQNVLGRGYFIDRPFEGDYHGAYTHLIQQDFIYNRVARESGVTHQQIVDFMGTPAGGNVWDLMFDYQSGARVFQSPEFLQETILSPTTPLR